MGKRKARTKLCKKFDLMNEALTLEKIGSVDDPCFGKLHDSRNSVCQRCGDAEICLIAMGQLQHIKRAKAEEKTTFRDMEEVDGTTVDKKEIRKMIKARVKELAKSKKDGKDIEFIINDVHATFFNSGFTKPKIRKIIDKMLDKSTHLKKRKTNLVWM